MPINQEDGSSQGHFSTPHSEQIKKTEPAHFAKRLREVITAAGTSTDRLRKIIVESLRPSSPVTDNALKDLLFHYRQVFMEILAQVDLNESASKSDEAKLASAIFNQELAADIYQARNSQETRANVEKLVTIIDELAVLDRKIGMTAQNLLNGARAQAGLTEYFLKQGFKVFFPDTQKPAEMRQWDVLGGADMIAMSEDGSVFVIIDVKARIYSDEQSGLLDRARVNEQDAFLSQENRKAREARQQLIVKGLREFLTSKGGMTFSGTQFTLLSTRIEIPPGPQYMNKIGKLNQKIQNDVTTQLKFVDKSGIINQYLT